MHTIRVWDLPTRLFHWGLMACVIGLVITGNVGGNWMNWHLKFGYAVLTLLLFRIVWGFVGGHWSLFSSFVRGPAAILRYLRGEALPGDDVGHNPLGALSVLGLLGILTLQVTSGLFSDDEIAFFGPLVGLVSGDTVSLATWYHKSVGKFIVMFLVVLHVGAIIYYRVAKKKNLVPPMIHGDKTLATACTPSRDSAGSRLLALVVFCACSLAVRWVVGLGAVSAPAF